MSARYSVRKSFLLLVVAASLSWLGLFIIARYAPEIAGQIVTAGRDPADQDGGFSDADRMNAIMPAAGPGTRQH